MCQYGDVSRMSLRECMNYAILVKIASNMNPFPNIPLEGRTLQCPGKSQDIWLYEWLGELKDQVSALWVSVHALMRHLVHPVLCLECLWTHLCLGARHQNGLRVCKTD